MRSQRLIQVKEYEEKEAERLIRAGDRDNFYFGIVCISFDQYHCTG